MLKNLRDPLGRLAVPQLRDARARTGLIQRLRGGREDALRAGPDQDIRLLDRIALTEKSFKLGNTADTIE